MQIKLNKRLTGLLLLGFFICTSFISSDPAKEQQVEISTIYGKIVVRLFNETPLHRDNFIKLVKQGFYDSLLFHRVIPSFMAQGGDPSSKHAQPGIPLGEGDIGYTIPAEFNRTLYHKKGALAAARNNNPDKASSGCQFYIVQGRIYTSAELNTIKDNINYNLKSTIFQNIMKSDSVKARIDDFTQRGDKDGMHAYINGMQPAIDKLYESQQIIYTTQQIRDYLSIGGTPQLDMNYTVFGQVVSGWNVIDSIAAQKTGPMDRPLKDLRMKMRLLK